MANPAGTPQEKPDLRVDAVWQGGARTPAWDRLWQWLLDEIGSCLDAVPRHGNDEAAVYETTAPEEANGGDDRPST